MVDESTILPSSHWPRCLRCQDNGEVEAVVTNRRGYPIRDEFGTFDTVTVPCPDCTSPNPADALGMYLDVRRWMRDHETPGYDEPDAIFDPMWEEDR